MNDELLLGGGLGVVAVVTMAMLFFYRKRPGKMLLALAVGALVALLLSSSLGSRQVLERCLPLSVLLIVVLLLSGFFVAVLFPVITSRHDARTVKILALFLGGAQLFLSLLLWRNADDGAQMEKIPVAKTEAELLALHEQPYRTRLHGVLTAGVAGEGGGAVDQGDSDRVILAYYVAVPSQQLPPAYEPTPWLPRLAVTLADGKVIPVQDGYRVGDTWNWPQAGPQTYQHSLRHGDPVVIWSDIGRQESLGASTEVTAALNHTRMVAVGSLEEFQSGYVRRAVFTGRLFRVLAWVMMPCAAIPWIAGWRRAGWLSRHGDNRPPKIRWTKKRALGE